MNVDAAITSSRPPLRVAVIIGSNREGRFGPTAARWFASHAELRDDLTVDLVDLAETPLPTALTNNPTAELAEVLGGLTKRLDLADAFVVVTPEYNHSYPASLKAAIDWHFTQWQAKPVGFVSYGGLSGGLRAVEHLRQVFAELHAVTVRETVSFHGAWARFGPDGQPKDPEACTAAATAMLDQLLWWGEALRDARTRSPYAG
ncbi:NADPH-dependent FMN reductase [Micromonospora sp. NBC_01796]|uniref:NADPH-dependent FMN reductase n=1 Tax=Micromonospora sp. NBC_01796 TaxID=2975987 RepID=UPI002DD8BF99|nr:NAD(P)H-dependent oxidoreductase [Micromonospora sp. NBC_01796]WSA85042.1 NAD(P)H-dependent oxidoreductase [Micromonospora sp. NBC_01796]